MTGQQQTIELIKAIKEDDGQAFSSLLEQFEPLITGAVGRFCSPPVYQQSDFEDLRQEAVLALYKAAKSFNEEQTEVTFGLYAKICINNRLISAKRQRLRSMRKNGRGVGRPRKNIAAEKKAGIKKDLPGDSQLHSFLNLARGDLTPKEAKVLDLYLAGACYKEIGDKLHCTVKSVDNALTRAKKKIKRYAGRQEQG